MSTSEPAVAEAGKTPHSWHERSVHLGPGLLRLADGTYRKPKHASFHLRCMGPLAHWEIDITVDLTDLPEGEERPLFLYPLPPQASISLCELTQNGEPLGPEPRVCAIDQLPEDAQQSTPSKSLLSTFGTESLPIFSLVLEPYLEAYQAGQPAQLRLVFGNGLPTVDGRICTTIPARVDELLQARGNTTITVHIELEDGDELVDEPTSSLPLEQSKEDDVFHLKGEGFENLERDLEVSFRPGRTEMPVTRLRRSSENFLFSIFPPTSIPASPQRRDLVFCVDASENLLDGLFDPIRDDLCAALRKLDDNDRFALVTYGRDIDGYEGGEFCEVAKVEEACRWLHTVEPKGRPDIQSLLTRIQALPSQPDRQLCVFLLAAGHVGNEPSILKSLDFDQSDRRYYAVGIGPSVQQAFLRRLALLTRGRCEVAPEGRCGEALERLLGQTRALLAEVTFETQDGKDVDFDVESLVPSRMTSLTPEGPVHCFGKGSPSSLRFRSKDETGVFFAGTVNARNTENPALSGVWAGMRVRELVDSVRLSTGAKRKQLRAESSALASEYGILIEDTVLVVETDDGLDVQLVALPYRWKRNQPAVPVTTAGKPADDSAPAFDWRKGLKARDGLFKGSKPGEGSEGSGEMRHGLRRSGELTSKPFREQSKPMLDRFAIGAASSASEESGETAAASAAAQPSATASVETAQEAIAEATQVPASESPQVSASKTESTAPVESVQEAVAEAGQVPASESPQGTPAEPPQVTSAEPPQVTSAEPPQVTSAEPPQVTSAESTQETVAKAALQETASESPRETVSEPAEPSAAAPAELSTPAPEATPAAVATVSRVVALPASAEPVFSYVSEPWVDAKLRMESYLEQVETLESRMAMASLAALPSEVSKAGPDLPRILAQAVGHLEKRGYFPAAVSVLGLLLKDYRSPEVIKKMESLLVDWANSLQPEQLPEAIHILQAGLRVCPGSDTLNGAMTSLWQRWKEAAEQQGELPEIAEWRQQWSSEAPGDPLLSSAQHELAKLRHQQQTMQQQQKAMTQEIASLREILEERLGALPGLLETLLARPVAAPPAAPPPEVPAAPSPSASSVTPVEAPVSAPPVASTEPPAVASTVSPPLAPIEPATEVAPPATDFEPAFNIELPLPDLALPPEPVSTPDPATPPVTSGETPAATGSTPAPSVEAPSQVEPSVTEAASPKAQPPMDSQPPAEAQPPAEPAPVEEPAVAPTVVEEPSDISEAPPDPEGQPEDSGESLNLTRDELLELLQAEPKDESGHRAVKKTMLEVKDRINFYRDLVRLDSEQPYHSLSLARAYRDAEQTKVAVVHYQKYLRSEKNDATAYLELADAYDELGKSNLSISARKAAELIS